jgi:hypothetical protein
VAGVPLPPVLPPFEQENKTTPNMIIEKKERVMVRILNVLIKTLLQNKFYNVMQQMYFLLIFMM